LKRDKIVFPRATDIGNDMWFMSVDGSHFLTLDPAHPEFSKDEGHYSKKFNKAAWSYELGISLTAGLIWMNGPYKAGKNNDIVIFRKPNGLLEKLRQLPGKKAIGDLGYRGEPKYVSFFNGHDPKPVAKFKTRALERHEHFNGMMKVFKILSERFRTSKEKFAKAFEAVAVICQYKCDLEMPLYDILIQAVIDAEDDLDYDDGEDDQE